MNDQAVEALRDAMEPPTWWTNRARLSPREILDRLEEHGYTVAPVNQIADISPGTPSAVNEQPVSETLWPEMAARAEQLAAWEARSDERLEAATFPVDVEPPALPQPHEMATAESPEPVAAESAPAESQRPGGLAGLMADLESKVAAVRHVHTEENAPPDEDQQRSA
jgi:hypothetical protein